MSDEVLVGPRFKEKRGAIEARCGEILARAEKLLSEGSAAIAEKAFSEVLGLRTSGRTLLGRARARLRLRRFQEAIDDAAAAEKTGASAFDALILQAECFEAQMRFPWATRALSRAAAVGDAKQAEVARSRQEQVNLRNKEWVKRSRGFKYDFDTHDIAHAWQRIARSQPVRRLPVPDVKQLPPKKPGHTRFVCVSDTHGMTRKIPPGNIPDGDVLIHAGDFTMKGSRGQITNFNKWLGTLPHPHKVVIAGNHDVCFDAAYYERAWKRFHFKGKINDIKAVKASLTNCIYLEDSSVVVRGFRIFGSPWQPEFCDWAFNLRRGAQCRAAWERIPDDVDVLITHGPPAGHGDMCKGGAMAGCMDLLFTVQQRVRPKAHIFGHIHEGYGVTTDEYTKYINASTCSFQYRPSQPAIVFDLPDPVVRTGPTRKNPASAAIATSGQEVKDQTTSE